MLTTHSPIPLLSALEALQLYSALKDIIFCRNLRVSECLNDEQLKLFCSLYQSITGNELNVDSYHTTLYGLANFCLALANSPVMQRFLMEDADGAEIWIKITGDVQRIKTDTIWKCCLSPEMLLETIADNNSNHAFYLWHLQLLAIFNREPEQIVADEKEDHKDSRTGLIRILCDRYEDAHLRLNDLVLNMLYSTTICREDIPRHEKWCITYYLGNLLLKPNTARAFIQTVNDDHLNELCNELASDPESIAERDEVFFRLTSQLRKIYCAIIAFIQQDIMTDPEQFLKEHGFGDNDINEVQFKLHNAGFEMVQYRKLLACAARMGFTEETLYEQYQQQVEYTDSRSLSMKPKAGARRQYLPPSASPVLNAMSYAAEWIFWATGRPSCAPPSPASEMSSLRPTAKRS